LNEKIGEVKLPELLGGFTLPIRHAFLLGMFHYHPQVLDQWVLKYRESVRQYLEDYDTAYAERSFYIPLPVELQEKASPELKLPKDKKRKLAKKLELEDLRSLCGKDRWCIRILGEGGLGKTTIAYQLALWALSDDVSRRLIPDRCALPIIIDPGIGYDYLQTVDVFMRVARERLEHAIGLSHSIPHGLFEQLLRSRRLLVILDGVSEMPIADGAPDVRADGTNSDFPVRAMIVTSRNESSFDHTVHCDLRPCGLDHNHLSPFIYQQLTAQGVVLRDDELESARKGLADLVHEREDITPLFAKLYVIQFAASRQATPSTNELPTTIPDLFLEYLNYINRHRAQGEPEDSEVHQAARTIAWECIRDSFKPTAAARARVEAAIDTAGINPATLGYLENKLRLIEVKMHVTTQVRFVLDPLAEYVAAMKVAETCGSDTQAWAELLYRIDNVISLTEIHGFLVALRDCCAASGPELGIPGEVQQRVRSLCSNGQAPSPPFDDHELRV
jgi:hypothetical protein